MISILITYAYFDLGLMNKEKINYNKYFYKENVKVKVKEKVKISYNYLKTYILRVKKMSNIGND